jgi:excinuclease ABC subunit C
MEKTLIRLPEGPGVYLMKDAKGTVLYVGKAKNLKARVKQYFAKSPDQRAMIPFLTAKVKEIDTIVTFSEKEALLLENTLIKKHKPKYNVFLKDDKTYISLLVTTKEKWPMIKLVRHKTLTRNDGKFFGPYTSTLAARETFDLLSSTFPLRECSNQELYSRKRPCLLYHMKRCIAPCVNKCTKEDYDLVVKQCLSFLQGKNQEVLFQLKEEMEKASDELAFEKAALLLKRIEHIEKFFSEAKSSVYYSGVSCDAFGMLQKDRFTFLLKLIFREGKLIDRETYHFSCVASSVEEALESFLLQHYEEQKQWPKEVLLPFVLEHSESLSEIVSEKAKQKINFFAPQKGEKKNIINLAMENTKSQFEKERLRQQDQEDLLLEMQETFSLNNLPVRIDCFDTSNLNRSDAVASMVVFLDGKKENRLSRLYKIERKGDDYSALKEVLTRRYVKAKQEKTLPDVIIMDGGKGQLNIALQILKELEIVSVDVISLVKEEARHDKGLTKEKVYIKGEAEAISISPQSSLLFFLQTIRDEAHRRAIEFHRKRRSKRLIKSILDDIPGIGPVKRASLLKHFGSIERLKEATLEELKMVPGISKTDIKSLSKELDLSFEIL